MAEVTEWVGNDFGTWAIQACDPRFADHDGSPLGLGKNEHCNAILATVEAVLHEEGFEGEFCKDIITMALEDPSDSRPNIILTDGGTGEELLWLEYQE